MAKFFGKIPVVETLAVFSLSTLMTWYILNKFYLHRIVQGFPGKSTYCHCCMGFYNAGQCEDYLICSNGLYHPLDGVSNLKYKLLHFLTTKIKFCKEKALAFNQDRYCHLALCLWLILFHVVGFRNKIIIYNSLAYCKVSYRVNEEKPLVTETLALSSLSTRYK